MNNLLTTIITSSLVATITGAIINGYIEDRKSKQSVRFEALAIAVALEGYAIICANKISAHNTAVTSEGAASLLLRSVPKFPQFSGVIRFFGPRKMSLANRIMMFSQEVYQANQSVAFWWEVVGDLEAMYQEAKIQGAKMGLQSLDLARDIREEFKLPHRILIFGDYDIRQLLKEQNRMV
ncbi:hypothetical protein [Geothrix sp. 21YS21S-4]|uniref:hypothetical protein n=1 Tax=Geothrix sp. 21YS21S-4 TaxID=3068889 RepID=UPI0027B8EBA8|nr:hypothetical protein [Geothrix sp. 21YS21S-4]